MIYYAQVESQLRYGICIWGSSSSLQKVFLLQKRIVRVMVGVSQRQSCKVYFTELGILTLPSLYVYECCTYVHKSRDKFIKNYEIHDKNTRQKNLFHVPFKKKTICKNCLFVSGLEMYNRLPKEITATTNLRLFKNKLKYYLVKKCLYTVNEFLV